ncbi:MAG TPA: PEP-CTERM sorting domain-containing protein [Anaerohalosphaeraceae bacterium]|nr:PEP-CTERM sorting domain-containing protein [Anaerohalosphaeraceae bacterium]
MTLYDYSKLNIHNTSPLEEGAGGIWDISLAGYSEFVISGGDIHRLTIGSYAIAQISGGWIGQIYSSQNATYTKHIEIICRPGYAYNSTTGYLTGLWGDGSTFSIRLDNPSGTSATIDNIKFTIIPEPATMLLLAVGGILLRRKS